MEVVNEQISKEANVKIEIVAGKIELTAALDTSGADVAVKVLVDSDYFLDLLASKIPGQIDDAVIALFKSALKAV
jgi:hypothetical protein